MQRVLIDTDPGADDALAVLMALNCPDLLIEGITTVGGNATLAEATNNALRLVDHVADRRELPIVAGADRPARGSFSHAYHVHGAEGAWRRPAGHDVEAASKGRGPVHTRPLVFVSGAANSHRARAADKRGRRA